MIGQNILTPSTFSENTGLKPLLGGREADSRKNGEGVPVKGTMGLRDQKEDLMAEAQHPK